MVSTKPDTGQAVKKRPWAVPEASNIDVSSSTANCVARPALSLGLNWDGEGVNFALYSEHAEKVELCLFDISGKT